MSRILCLFQIMNKERRIYICIFFVMSQAPNAGCAHTLTKETHKINHYLQTGIKVHSSSSKFHHHLVNPSKPELQKTHHPQYDNILYSPTHSPHPTPQFPFVTTHPPWSPPASHPQPRHRSASVLA